MFKKMLLLIGLIAMMAPQVDAQTKTLGISVGPQLGYYKAQDADDGNLMGGLAFRFKSKQIFGFEASINYKHEKYSNNQLAVRSWPIMLTGLVYPVPNIYGEAGVGWYYVTYDYDQNKLPLFKDKTTHEFGWHFGAGVEVPVGEKFKVTGDVRYVFLDYEFEEIPGSDNLNSNFYVITIGLLFAL